MVRIEEPCPAPSWLCTPLCPKANTCTRRDHRTKRTTRTIPICTRNWFETRQQRKFEIRTNSNVEIRKLAIIGIRISNLLRISRFDFRIFEMYPHRIRLRGPWEYKPVSGPDPLPAPGRMTMPCRWKDQGLPGFSGKV